MWCDIGNKAFGVRALQARLGVSPANCLHVGDQFASSIGNDFAARLASPTLWVAGPKETQHVLKRLLEARGISTKVEKRAEWPPSTKRSLIWTSNRNLDYLAGASNTNSLPEQEADWVRG